MNDRTTREMEIGEMEISNHQLAIRLHGEDFDKDSKLITECQLKIDKAKERQAIAKNCIEEFTKRLQEQ